MTSALPRNLVICCDGTNNQHGKRNTNTNVIRLFENLQADDNQKIFYDPGVGTSSRAIFTPIRWFQMKASQALGLDLQQNVEDAYRFLMDNYQEGDQIFLFGFSRGAHTVRRLASMLAKCGLLHKGSNNMIPYATRMYLDQKKNISDESRAFQKIFSRPCPVYFIGVWDTVSAVSSLLPRPKLDGSLTEAVLYAYHAVSIDEKRIQFPPSLFNRKNTNHIEEVWFAGVHSDVGGSYTERGLADVALKWMVGKARAVENPLRFINGAFSDLQPNAEGIQHESWDFKWWLIPFPMYGFLALLILSFIQGILAFLNLWWPITDRPLNAAFAIIEAYPYHFVLSLMMLGLCGRWRRTIPPKAHLHRSVEERRKSKKVTYNPRNLSKIYNSAKIVD